jgi:acyl carrier protein
MWNENKLTQFISEKLSIEIDLNNIDKPLRDMGVDSIGFVTLILEIQQDFDVEFDDEDLNYDSQISATGFLTKINRYFGS